MQTHPIGTLRLGSSSLQVARIGCGCMHLAGSWDDAPLPAETLPRAARLVDAALAQGIDFFDHADIYCRGKSEEVFGRLLQSRPGLRPKLILQSKCGIRLPEGDRSFTIYDFRRDHILHSVEASLRRLATDYLDILLLHRPDPLIEPEEVASAFDALRRSGKVRHFGVSNHSAAQMALLHAHLDVPLVANQLELNIVHAGLFDQGVRVNLTSPGEDSTGTLEYCRLHDITVQAWSPLARGYLTGRSPAPGHPREARWTRAAQAVRSMAERKGTSPEAVCIAWFLRHPARIQPIVGTTEPVRLEACAQAASIDLSHEEWYELFVAGRDGPLP